MAAFEYLAMTESGHKQRGVEEADSPRQVRQRLRERQLIPLTVKPARARRQAGSVKHKGGLGSAELALLTRQLATLVQAALPLDEVLAACAAQAGKRRLTSMLLAIRARVLEGHGLAQAMADFPAAFPALYRATVAAGERSGHLDKVLLQLASHTEARQAARQQVQLALLYPCILLLASLAIVAFLLGFVVPDVVQVFADSGQQLPWLTRALIACSAAVRDYGVAGLLVLGLSGTAALALLRSPRWRQRWHRLQLHIPMVGNVIRASNCTRFASTLGILCSSGVPLVDALKIAAEVVSNQPIRHAMQGVARSVQEGNSLTRALENSGGFPPMMLYMIASGERSGELHSMLERAARHQEQQLANRIALLVGLFEPATLVFMGAAVLLIVLAILMPILNLNQLIH
ncbi:type II secretion system inner membrane protein GspF [Pseudomonas sp. R5(2019)]|uniref:type II secretion system inner membrane protein GspF n=1 Tax=Pseudomonas sp. R5(2019) TaxID=2697566 RepID=UPI001412101E|nr:type II secretion system inner membrane protein GspF [Pseudomonas sp. R5(2019)]NBA96202.1 type II secretion system inner membrane protein GspF [Pseudomonas sp. R5(2019)]